MVLALNSISNSSKASQPEVSTFAGKYTAGDTRTRHIGNVKVDVSSDDWQAGFDKIDIAPKDGKLSVEEICARRDKEATLAKFMFWTIPGNWQPLKIKDFRKNINLKESQTESYRNNN